MDINELMDSYENYNQFLITTPAKEYTQEEPDFFEALDFKDKDDSYVKND